jgi:hypothetical protein
MLKSIIGSSGNSISISPFLKSDAKLQNFS